MTINYARLKNWPFRDVEQSYTEKDCMLYALGLGLGYDPMDERQLGFVYEKNLKTLPTMAVVLGYPGFWVKDQASGIDWVRIVHGEQALTVHRALPVAGTVVGRTRIRAVVDKGKDKGALLVQQRTLHDKASGALLATIDHVTFCRADGGFSELPDDGPRGGDPAPPPKPAVPESAPEAVCDLPTLPQAALIYRLCADNNPLHAEPAVAKAAGFPRPILHGLATYGVAGHAILKTCCDYEPARLKSIGVRFSAPVFPGETIRTEMWRRGSQVQFRARVLERDLVVLSHGTAEVLP
ncbi:MAG: MaoC family dehydratase N-terminal domain-containing protein [Betaproteobacteria bacterium]|nr:MaoC family dehydratase N-terminal domain-containing protein [Betaproteobacteria bacterium]